jgi:Tfp pilus assembly protein PilO
MNKKRILELYNLGGTMLRKSLVKFMSVGTVLAVSYFFTACTPKVTEEQLTKLKQLRGQERDLTSQIAAKKNDKASLEKELQARLAELKECQKESDFIKSKLTNWPDVWPDWKPEAK